MRRANRRQHVTPALWHPSRDDLVIENTDDAARLFRRNRQPELHQLVQRHAEADSNVSRVLLASADEFARIDARADDLIREIHAPSTLELLPDFERVYGLPDPCLGEEQSTPQRIASLVQRIVSIDGQTPEYYIGIAATLGFTITIIEFPSFDVEDDVDSPIYDTAWDFAWQVNAPLNTVGELTVEATVADPLAWFGNAQLECVIEKLKPAHTEVIFAYA
jgi:uncharacterized protein YmfQ (DUF2313 family)